MMRFSVFKILILLFFKISAQEIKVKVELENNFYFSKTNILSVFDSKKGLIKKGKLEEINQLSIINFPCTLFFLC